TPWRASDTAVGAQEKILQISSLVPMFGAAIPERFTGTGRNMSSQMVDNFHIRGNRRGVDGQAAIDRIEENHEIDGDGTTARQNAGLIQAMSCADNRCSA